LNVEKIIIALFILCIVAAPAEAAKTAERPPSNEPTLSCVAEGRKVTITVSGDLSSLRAGLSLPENGAKICMVSGDRTAGSAKIADKIELCREDKRDPKRKLVFGPMPILGRSFDRFTIYFLVGEKSYLSQSGSAQGTEPLKVVGACRYVKSSGGFTITADPNAEQNKKTR
jgi:hypothetical protein